MKKLTIVVLLFYSAACFASQKAITDTGEEVLLNSDGTWQYADDSKKPGLEIKTNDTQYEKPDGSKFLLKSTRNKSAFWINTDKWTFKKTKDSTTPSEHTFRMKNSDLYAIAITEGFEISLESFSEIALENAKKAAPDAKIMNQEYRIVNGKKVLHMEIKGTIQSMKFTYLGYYYSDESGATQLITYTASNLIERYKADINDILNGLALQ